MSGGGLAIKKNNKQEILYDLLLVVLIFVKNETETKQEKSMQRSEIAKSHRFFFLFASLHQVVIAIFYSEFLVPGLQEHCVLFGAHLLTLVPELDLSPACI